MSIAVRFTMRNLSPRISVYSPLIESAKKPLGGKNKDEKGDKCANWKRKAQLTE